MAIIPDRVPIVTTADMISGPEHGQWTYKEYAALPDDGKRYEVVNGVLYIMAPSPNRWHQEAVGEIFAELRNHVKLSGLGSVYIAPFDVELAPHDIVQPDVIVVLNAHAHVITESRILGTPDLVVEVASPGTAGYDRREKQDTYARTGIPEYWIVDPAAHTIEVLELHLDAYRSLGVFQGQATLPSRVIPTFPVRVEQFFS